ncbi:MAG TPA: oligopeptide:H+ symporter [Phenylobacterium sp.]|jgi:POT family proton-dependent oligopeptide transporter|uniref:peptide MFS transporter n=1 Tax=Phenylobacterium sp. TaxID=1871053 RepID=UPI002C70327B|nr:oligopeptide:H+ symporter [Phenylobacterium sp.]HXA41257.1 oligopeptide:H+ symporter [Phenylobacterium sp.]
MDIVIVAGIVVAAATAIPVVLQLRQHPRGLRILFFAEMWERFSYYGMRGLLIFYLTQHFLFDDKTAAGSYGAYTSLVYLLPVIGGFLADRFLGARKAVAFGALLLVAGHFTMALEGEPATQVLTTHGAAYNFQVTGRADARQVKLLVDRQAYAYSAAADGGLDIKGLPASAPLPAHLAKGDYQISVARQAPLFKNILFLALALIIMGVGFLKANIAAMVGQLYPQGDPRRDPGFTLYYYGINLGSFLASIACGWLGQTIGWWAGFGAAGIGMALGWIVFVLGKPMLEGKGEPPDPAALAKPIAGPLNTEWLIYIAGLAGVAAVWVVVQSFAIVSGLLGVGAIAVLGYLIWYMTAKADKVERERLLLAIVLILASVVFWALYEQGGSSLNLFAERNVNLHLYGDQSMKPAQAQSFQSGWILILAPVMAALWTFLGRFGRDPNPVAKFGAGLLLIGASYYVLIFGAQFAGADFKSPLIFLAGAYLMQTTGEMCVSPVGLSQMTKLAPPLLISTLMATWYLGTAGAQFVAAKIAQLTASDTIGGQVLDAGKALATYSHVFGVIGLWGLGAGLLMIVLSPWLKRWAHGASDTK